MNKAGQSKHIGGSYETTSEDKKEMEVNYPTGATVELVKMDDEPRMKIGMKGKVSHIDDALGIHVRWENGSGLAVIYGEDECKVI